MSDTIKLTPPKAGTKFARLVQSTSRGNEPITTAGIQY